MTEKRFYYNTFYYPNTDEIMEYEIIDRESFPNYPNHNESTDLCGWYIYISENDSNWQDMCIDKLNELNDENKVLKVTNGEMEDYLARMEEENKELRSDRDYWKTLAQSLAKTNGTLKLKDEHIRWKRVDV